MVILEMLKRLQIHHYRNGQWYRQCPRRSRPAFTPEHPGTRQKVGNTVGCRRMERLLSAFLHEGRQSPPSISCRPPAEVTIRVRRRPAVFMMIGRESRAGFAPRPVDAASSCQRAVARFIREHRVKDALPVLRVEGRWRHGVPPRRSRRRHMPVNTLPSCYREARQARERGGRFSIEMLHVETWRGRRYTCEVR